MHCCICPLYIDMKCLKEPQNQAFHFRYKGECTSQCITWSLCSILAGTDNQVLLSNLQTIKLFRIRLTIISEEEEAGGGQSRLFVGGLPQGVSTEQVRGLFKQYGDVKDVYIPAGQFNCLYESPIMTHHYDSYQNYDTL